MFAYRYNLKDLGYSEEDYDSVARRALTLARAASAIDTGKFRRGWVVDVVGDTLMVSNAVRYAIFVELGSIISTKHKHKIRRALSTLGLEKGVASFGAGPKGQKGFNIKDEAEEGLDEDLTTVIVNQEGTITTVKPITEQEIRSPALLLNRFRAERATTPAGSQKSQLFNRSRLLKLLIAAGIANQIINKEETQNGI